MSGHQLQPQAVAVGVAALELSKAIDEATGPLTSADLRHVGLIADALRAEADRLDALKERP